MCYGAPGKNRKDGSKPTKQDKFGIYILESYDFTEGNFPCERLDTKIKKWMDRLRNRLLLSIDRDSYI